MEPVLWSVKYKPAGWDDFIGQDSAISQLRKFATAGTYPNMILYGPEGTGKSCAADIFAREILGDSYGPNFKWLNVRDLRTYPVSKAKRDIRALAKLSRDERTSLDEYMSVVFQEAKARRKARGMSGNPNRSQLLQQAIRLFASTVSVTDEKVKILVLDESDALDNNMQQALRRTMEIYNDACRFILVTTKVGGWSPAIVSRCLLIRFPQPSQDSVESLIRNISISEGIDIDEPVISVIATQSNGDMRRATNLLQIAAANGTTITEDEVYEVSETALTFNVRRMITNAISGDFVDARNIVRNLIALDGYSPTAVIEEMQRDLVKRPFEPALLSRILDRVAEIDYRLTQAKNPFVQLAALLASIGHFSSESN
ncbi:MAG: AAA family ATPase, partial [Candidatus Thorarchaeota archaeon]